MTFADAKSFRSFGGWFAVVLIVAPSLAAMLDIALPNDLVTTANGHELVISRLSLSAPRFEVLRRRVAQMPGVRSVSA